MSGPQTLSIQEFLLGYILGDGLDEAHEPDDIDARATLLRHEVARHEVRTVTVVTQGSRRTLTRCRTCPRDPAWPCTALRVLARPYARHPAYREEWSPTSATSELVGADDRLPT